MRFKRGFSALLLAVAVVALDRATKHWAMRTLAQPVVASKRVALALLREYGRGV